MIASLENENETDSESLDQDQLVIRISWFSAFLLLLIFLVIVLQKSSEAGSAVLTDISFNRIDEKSVHIVLSVEGIVGHPKVYRMEQPTQIVMDFSDLKYPMSRKRRFNLRTEGVDHVLLAQTNKRLRLVVSLKKIAGFTFIRLREGFLLTVFSGKPA